MSHPVGRVSSDLSGSNYATATTVGLHHHQSTSSSDNINGASKARQRLLLLFSGVGAWRRGQAGGGTTDDSGSKKRQVKGSSSKRGALDVGQVVKKYTSMVEQLLMTSFSGGSGRERRWELWRRRPHSFASAGGSWNGQSKRHRGRLSSAPASLRGSPGNSGHLSVSMSSEESTMEELQSAIQAAIAHCKNSSIAVATHAGGDKCKY